MEGDISVSKSIPFLGQKGIVIFLAIMAIILALFVSPVPAEDQSNKENEWEFVVAPYLWFLALEGAIN